MSDGSRSPLGAAATLASAMFGRRKTIPPSLRPAWEAFQAQVDRVAAARRALLSCLPVGRVDPVPVPVGLDLIRDELDAVAAELDSWRRPEVEAEWQQCRAALDEARSAIAPAHEVAASSGELEELLEAVGEVVEPLEAWQAAERAWLALRVRG